MAERIYSPKQVEEITGASYHETIRVPFYYAPPFLDVLKRELLRKLRSRGGRRTVPGRDVVRKVRFSDKDWELLNDISTKWSERGASISPAQVASMIVEISLSSLGPAGNHAPALSVDR